jgi:serine/threonine protein kinase
VGKKIICVILDKNQLNLMRLIHAMRSNGPLPQVILSLNYHMAIDIWGLGCILVELYTGFPIFPGENKQEQLSCIMELLGIPDKDFVDRSPHKRIFLSKSVLYYIQFVNELDI